ncbi:MAG: hypothetical protein HUJ86_05790 [Synergistes sp.]|nr:hypothetical protein [Synergistes sp.]
MKKTIGKLLCAALIAAAAASPAAAGESERKAAEMIGTRLFDLVHPESIKVTVTNGKKKAWVECTGANFSGLRFATMKIEADLNKMPDKVTGGAEALSKYIKSSRGELRLLEKDVNKYFRTKETDNFSNLKFNFKPGSYEATGKFSADTKLKKISFDMKALGKLGMHSDGIYLEDTKIYTGIIKQPDFIVNLVLSKAVNPLLRFSEIPFPVKFKKLEMTDDAVFLTGEPKKISEGDTWQRKR